MSQERFHMLVGFGVIAGAAFLLYLLGAWIYHRFSPVPSLSLAVSAWFDPPSAGGASQLRVAGVVLEDGKPVAKDRLRLSVEAWKKGITQSLFVDVSDGRFDSGEQPAFRLLTPDDRLRIRAAYAKGGAEATEEVYLGARIPRVSRGAALVALACFAVCTLGFLWLFTGPPLPGKNTWAIITSYVIMIVFLAVPLALPPVISVMSPEIMAAMRETPVGVLVADPEKGGLGRQWVLNIGGVVVPSSPAPAAPSPAPAQPTSSAPPSQAPAAAPATPPAPGPAPAQPPAAPATQAAAPSTQAVPAASSAAPASSTATPQARPPSPASGAPTPSSEDSVVTIQGGLVIPLYVLILSLIGGAINMTRKLPDFQRDATSLNMGRYLDAAKGAAAQAFSSARRVLGSRTPMPGVPSAPPEEANPPEEGQSPPTVETEAAEASTQAPAETPEERFLRQTAEWRKGLITQHMYLLSAPFLAIAVYYLLVWLDLLRQPALVLVSFSVGLISDKIVGRILGIATGIVEAAPAAAGAAAQRQQVASPADTVRK